MLTLKEIVNNSFYKKIKILNVADFELWLEYASAIAYADDTSISISAKRVVKLLSKLEKYAMNVVRYMASNGLVANPKKTAFIILYQPKSMKKESPISINIGDVIVKQESSAKLLGVTLSKDQGWK